MEEIEIWKPILLDGIRDYEISSKGRLKALKKQVVFSDKRVRNYPEIILKNGVDTKGYEKGCIHYLDGKIMYFRIHQLVARAFIPNPEGKKCVNHKNSIRTDNNLENLEWATVTENNRHAVLLGRIYKPAKKISIDDAFKIRELYKEGCYFQKEIGLMFGLKQAQISRIVNNKRWI